MNKVFKLLTFILCALMLISCANNTIQTGKVKLATQNEKTLKPEEVQPVTEYEYVLASNYKTYKGTTTDNTITFDKVVVGNYSITVSGKDKEGTVTQKGYEKVSVNAGAVSNVQIQMNLICEENTTGTLKLPIDWSEVVSESNFANGLADGLKFDLYINDELYESVVVFDTDTHTTELVFEVPAGLDQNIYLNISNNVTGQKLVRNLFTSFADIYTGQIIVPDENEANSGKIKLDSIITADNISNIQITSAVNSAIITWDNPTDKGKNLVKEVYLTYYSEDTDKKTITIKQDETTLSGETIISGLDTSKKYSLEYSALSFNGVTSRVNKHPKTFAPLIFVESLEIDEDTIPSNSIVSGDSFLINATVKPDNVTNKNVNWEITPSDVLTYENGLFTANKPGIATIKATTEGTDEKGNTLTKTLDKTVSVILKSPQVYSAVQEKGIIINWTNIEYETGYELYEIVDGGEAQLLATLAADRVTYLKDENVIAGSSYQYYVIAITTEVENANSVNKTPTTAVTPVVPNIEIIPPTLGEGFKLEFTEASKDLIITEENPMLTFKMPKLENIVSYDWYINSKHIKGGSYEEANYFEITKESEGIFTDASATYNYLTIKVTDNKGNIYSATTPFEIIDVLPTGVKVYINGEEDTKRFISTEVRTLELTCLVLPENASNTNVTFASSDTTVATVDAKGLVTILKAGDVAITVSPIYGESTTINFKFYTPTFDSPLELLNAVNDALYTHINQANTNFEGDWWSLGGKKYGEEGTEYYIRSSYSASANQNDGVGTINLNKYAPQQTIFTELTTTTAIKVWAYNPGGLGETGYLGDDPLQTIGYNDEGTIRIALPYNQGYANIQYKNINVYGADRTNGQYVISFEPIVFEEQKYYLHQGTVIYDSNVNVHRLFNRT